MTRAVEFFMIPAIIFHSIIVASQSLHRYRTNHLVKRNDKSTSCSAHKPTLMTMIKVTRHATIFQVFVLLAMTLCACSSAQRTNVTPVGKFVSIFDGKTLSNWKYDTTYWHIENGVLMGEVTP